MIHLDSRCLFSKWGFNDGDIPDTFYEWVYEYHMYAYGRFNTDDWRRVLCVLVRTRLLPKMENPPEVYEIITSHNPIRAVEGQNRADFRHVIVPVAFHHILDLLMPIEGRIDDGGVKALSQ